MKKVLFLLLLCVGVANAQSPGEYWSQIPESSVNLSGKRQIVPQKYLTFKLQVDELRQRLRSAPTEDESTIDKSTCIIIIPLPDGSFQRFKVIDSPVMAKELAAAYPNIKTYSVKGIDDPYANGKIDLNDFGFHGMIFSVNGDFFIDPYCLGNNQDHISYYTADFKKDEKDIIPEAGVERQDPATLKDKQKKTANAGQANKQPPMCVGSQLKTYRLAVACTGEYAVAATGSATPTKAQVLQRVVTSVNRVDGVYEKDLSIRLVLVPNDTIILYTNGSTDSFTGTANTNANLLINLSQTIITNSIGTANFDIGHTFSTGGGGLANLGCVCVANQKARGITGSASPVGDPYDIDYVAHEIGHQFGGNHTFNAITGSCNGNRDPGSSVEPGSGVTIMAYAGICSSNNLASNSIPYFHAFSYDEIINFTTFGLGSTCPAVTSSGNLPPVVNGGGNLVVPKSTPFILTGSGTDPDGDVISFSWEEMDAGPVAGNWNSGTKPFFRSYAPVASPIRLIPRSTVVLNGNYTGTAGEYLPASAQILNFRLTARDNKMGGGGVCFANMVVQVDSSGPLQVVYPSISGISWVVNTQQTITWNPNQTDQPPVSCDSVRILISYNSGNTYTTLVGSSPNMGWQQISVPNLSATINTCRIRVEAKGNVFYDISNNDFTISTDPFVCISTVSDNNPVSLSVWPNPASGSISFAANNLAQQTHVEVRDVIGRLVFEKNYSGTNALRDQLDLEFLGSGVYILKVESGEKQSMHRFVIEK